MNTKVIKIICSICLLASFGNAKCMNLANVLKVYLLRQDNIFYAIQNGDIKTVERLLKDKKIDLSHTGLHGQTPLNYAFNKLAWYEINKPDNKNAPVCRQIAKLLLSHCTDDVVNKADERGYTPLYWICRANDLEMAKLLLQRSTDDTVNGANTYGQTPLFWACRDNNLEMAKLLLQRSTDDTVNRADTYGQTPLFWACNRNNLEMVELIIKRCTSETLNRTTTSGRTLLHWACKNNNIQIVLLLLKYCTTETINRAEFVQSVTPLTCVCTNGNVRIMKLLLPHCTNETINKVEDFYGTTPLQHVVWKDYPELTTLLVENSANISVCKNYHLTEIINRKLERCLQPIIEYNKLWNDKTKFVLGKKDHPEAFKSLVRVEYGRAVRNSHKTPIMSNLFFSQLYNNAQVDLKEIFGVDRQKNIYKFIKEVSEKNCIWPGPENEKSLLDQSDFYEKLQRNTKFTDVRVSTRQ